MLARLFVFFGGLLVLALTAALVGPYFIDWTNYRADFEREASAFIADSLAQTSTSQRPEACPDETKRTLLTLEKVVRKSAERTSAASRRPPSLASLRGVRPAGRSLTPTG